MAVTVENGEETPVPGPDTFDPNEYLEGKSTFPIYKHTLFLDQETGMILSQVYEDIKEHEKRKDQLLAQQRVLSTQSGSSSLVDERSEDTAEKLEEISDILEELEKEKSSLEEELKKSALILCLQVRTAKELGRVVHRAEKDYTKKNGKGSDTDVEYITDKSDYVLLAQLTAFCVKVINSKGQEAPAPGREWFASLLKRLIPSEGQRLFAKVNMAMSGSTAWAERLDAGFPGGSSDLGNGEVDGSGPEDSQGLDNPSDHSSNR